MIRINQTALRATSRFAALKDARYYLNGVYVQASPFETRLVATDGHTLAAHRGLRPSVDLNGGYADLIIPIGTVQAVLKWKQPLKAGELPIELSQVADAVWKLSLVDQSLQFVPVDGKFVDYQRVVPVKLDGTPAQYNPEYLMRCKAAVTDFTGEKGGAAVIGVGYNGAGPAVVDCMCDDFVALVMPLRASAPLIEASGWARVPVAVALKEAA